MNCWEFMKCERQPDGEKVSEFGISPAATDTTLNRANGGKNVGRCCCCRVCHTLCNGEVPSTSASKLINCIECEFFKKFRIKKEIFPVLLSNHSNS